MSFLAHVPYTDMGQPIEGLLVAGGIAFGELLGLTLEAQRAQVQVEVEREAQSGFEPHGQAADVQHGPGRATGPVAVG